MNTSFVAMETLFVGTNLMQFDRLPSTNDFLLELSRTKSLPEGTLVQAFDQVNGRGQQGNSWESSPHKNLTFSLLLHPKFLNVQHQFDLSKVISIAIVEYLQSLCQQVRIKWPNDIYVGKQKIAGILIENSLEGIQLRQSIVGVGLNVNQEDFSSALSFVTSICKESGVRHDLNAILSGLCQKMEKWYMKLRNGSKDIDETYQGLLFQKNVPALYEDDNGRFMAKIIEVNEKGQLVLEDEQEEKRTYNFKEVRFLLNG